MAITKTHKAFRWVAAMPIDANNVLLEQAFARFLVLVRTKVARSHQPIKTRCMARLGFSDQSHVDSC